LKIKKEKFEDIKGAIRSSISKDRQYNDQKGNQKQYIEGDNTMAKSVKIPKGQSEAVYRRTDNKGAIRSSISKDRQYNDQKKKGQTMIYKTLHKKRSSNTNPTKERG
jgi:hypothetical protein